MFFGQLNRGESQDLVSRFVPRPGSLVTTRRTRSNATRSEPETDLPLLPRHTRLQFLEPVEDHLDLRRSGDPGRTGQVGRDDTQESLTVERDVVAPLEPGTAFQETTHHRHRVAE